MVGRVEVAEVVLWGSMIGAVSWAEDAGLADFEYTAEFQTSGIELAPLVMPLGPGIHRFAELSRESYRGLPGLLADALPDRFGNLLIDQWVQRQGRTVDSFSPIERLCYLGRRGMGALEFEPARAGALAHDEGRLLEVGRLVDLAAAAIAQKDSLDISTDDEDAFNDIIRVGTSAGGARAKAVIAWNETTGEIRSGQVDTDEGFSHWLLKFDGVADNRDKELADPQGYGKIEFAYSQMARRAGISMAPTRLLHERGRSHFMTRRFDRTADGEKLHMQTLFAIAHFDFNQAGSYSYEQALSVMRRLGLPFDDMVEQVRRAAFNVMARNQDDHTKNIAFLMDRAGAWRLSPAYDITWAYNPDGQWTNQHQMTLNAKRDGFARDDLVVLAAEAGLSGRRSDAVLADVADAIAMWPEFAEEAEVDAATAAAIGSNLRHLG